MHDIRFERLKEIYCKSVADICAEYIKEKWSYESILKTLDYDYDVYYVALKGDEVCGFAGAMIGLDEAEILNIAVCEKYRRMGIANGLVELLEEETAKRNVSKILLEVRSSNESAIAFYKKIGFETYGKRKGYYSNPKEDAILMIKNIGMEEK